MGKIHDIINEQKTDLKKHIYRYLVTIISAILISLIYFATCDVNINKNEYLKHIYTVMCFFICGAFVTETLFVHKNESRKWGLLGLFYAISIVFAIAADVLIYQTVFTDKTNYLISVYILAIIVTFLFISIMRIIRENNLSVEKYFARIIFGLLKIWGLFLILYLATVLILEMYDTLIVKIEYWDVLQKVEILLAGFVYFPYSLMVISNVEEDNSGFTKGLFMYALMPCVVIATLIIYMYIIGIIIKFELPSNEVFYVCAVYFMLSCPIWLITYAFLKDKSEQEGKSYGIYQKITGCMAYIFALCIVLEIICIGIRISNFGLTESRYMAVFLIIFQIIYVVWKPLMRALKKDTEYYGLMYVLLFMFLIGLVVPGINIKSATYISQKNRFENALDKDDMLSAKGSYKYLQYDIYGKIYLEENFTEAEKDELLKAMYIEVEDNSHYDDSYIYEEYVYSRSRYIKENGIDISGYSLIKPFTYTEIMHTYEDDILLDIVTDKADEEILRNVDFTECMDYYLNDETSNNEKTYVIIYDENITLVIENMEFYINEYANYIKNININGYVLYR